MSLYTVQRAWTLDNSKTLQGLMDYETAPWAKKGLIDWTVRSGLEGSKLVLKIFSKTASERYWARTDSPQIIADIFRNTVNLQKKYFSSKQQKFKIRNLNLSPGKSLSFEYNPLAYHPAGCSFDLQISRCKTRKIESFLNSKKPFKYWPFQYLRILKWPLEPQYP